MKCVIFAGGKGTRLRTYDDMMPKPLVTIGGNPIIWHIMKIYNYYGIKDFILCLGYGQEHFKKYFVDLINKDNDIKISFKDRKIKFLNHNFTDINVSLIDTGVETLTGGRLKRIEKYLENDEEFLLTYGDAVSDVDINDLIKFHKEKNKLITITSVKRKENFGIIKITKDNIIKDFQEKNENDSKLINAGFMVVNKKVFTYLKEDSGAFEKEILEKLSRENKVCSYIHNGFWQCMDYQNEREYLNKLISENKAPWIKW